VSLQALFAMRVSQSTGLNWSEIPYKGGAVAVQGVLSNAIHGYFASNNLALTVVKNPRVNIVASTGKSRSPTLPNTPTFVELGFPELQEETVWAMYARTETPAPILAKLKTELAAVLKSPAITEKLTAVTMEPYDRSLEQYQKEAEASTAAFVATVKRLGITPQ